MKLSLILSRLWLGLCAALVLIPIAVILASLGDIDVELWSFFLENELPTLLLNTLYLSVGVGIGVSFLGATSAWLTSMYRFPGQRFFSWAMMLPLAVPAYVLAFVQLGMFDYTGPISTFLRETLGFRQGLPDIRNGFGLTVVMCLTFYPYVYLLAKNAFSDMGNRALEVGASLGLSPRQSFIKIALPMARPWIAGGTILALMEVLADFGTVSVFNYDTFTTAIYDAWFGYFSLETAKQLATLLITLVLVLVVLEHLSRGKKRFEQAGRSNQHLKKTLTGTKKWLAFGYCTLLLTLAFFVPIVQLMIWAIASFDMASLMDLWTQTWHTLVVGLIAAVIVASFALGLSLATRNDNSRLALILANIAKLGYAIPGTVLAVGVFVPVAWLDNQLIESLALDTTAIFKGTLMAMFVAYLIRFLALGVSSIHAGMERIKRSHIEAAATLGVVGTSVVRRIYLPLLKGSVGVAMLITFVDVMKEMPITLMMRPHDWDMLSVRIYAFTTEGIYDKAALPALVIIAIGLIPVILFSKMGQK